MDNICYSEPIEGLVTEVQVVAMAEGEMGISNNPYIAFASERLYRVVFSRREPRSDLVH